MTFRNKLIATAFIALTSLNIQAAPITFFGEDLGLGESTALNVFPNATTAESSFLSYLSGVGTEDFESFSNGTSAPLALDFDVAGTATLGGGGSVQSAPVGSTNGYGRYGTSGTNYWQASSTSFTIGFSAPIAAFGFYGIDIGDFNGQVVINVTYSDTTTESFNIGNSINTSGGGVLFWGLINQTKTFTNLSFSNTSGNDSFAFDDMTIGSVEQIRDTNPIPVPASILLFALGLSCLVNRRRKQS
ncbi:PEP-CTERM sorting domain-containing protein [Bowmanella sp. Y26]|uniref:PEP-CTERM sorting domain-containing protein n=1 Tax=Bowmanella yangjiangensis TaxID=2811230 RepID=UPI001BDC08C2|nr:PEP-CTERM sorting domain-containing protein [Bowmanella yangjiangensis]MBT1062190.1 PEP-CTERM sorting domain-containing protein [Bowmanella yangjiangensis]